MPKIANAGHLRTIWRYAIQLRVRTQTLWPVWLGIVFPASSHGVVVDDGEGAGHPCSDERRPPETRGENSVRRSGLPTALAKIGASARTGYWSSCSRMIDTSQPGSGTCVDRCALGYGLKRGVPVDLAHGADRAGLVGGIGGLRDLSIGDALLRGVSAGLCTRSPVTEGVDR